MSGVEAVHARWARGSRWWHAGLLAVVVAALVMELVQLFSGGPDANSGERSAGLSVGARLVRFFSYFTIDSNILVAVTCVLLVLAPGRDGRWWRVLRLDALLSITITGLVFAIVLAPDLDLHGMALVSTIGLHYIAPPAAVVGWLLFGPRGQVDRRTIAWAFVWPAVWIGYTLAHGAASGWYPYPFLEAFRIGYGAVVRNVFMVLVIAAALALAFARIDRWLAARGTAREAA